MTVRIRPGTVEKFIKKISSGRYLIHIRAEPESVQDYKFDYITEAQGYPMPIFSYTCSDTKVDVKMISFDTSTIVFYISNPSDYKNVIIISLEIHQDDVHELDASHSYDQTIESI